MAVWFNGYPLPPSVNKYLMPVAGKWVQNQRGKRYQQGRWVKTDVHRAFLDQCFLWRNLNLTGFDKIKEALHRSKSEVESRGGRFALDVNCFFLFHVEQIYSKDNNAKRNDADNRLKPCLDSLSALLEIDDRHFFSSSCEKVITSKESNQCTLIRISQTTPRTMEQIKSQMLMEQRQGS